MDALALDPVLARACGLVDLEPEGPGVVSSEKRRVVEQSEEARREAPPHDHIALMIASANSEHFTSFAPCMSRAKS